VAGSTSSRRPQGMAMQTLVGRGIDSMITIDGSIGEGGGQVLRTALALSIATGRPFRLDNIRSGRQKPGLLRQHLTAVQAATAVGDAQVEGDMLGSRALTFVPRAIRAGDYRFAVGTAGSATLVMQTVLPPLLLAPGESTLVLEGGTHNPFAPPFDFLQRAFVPLVNRLGPRIETTLNRPGFYPAGGGAFSATIRPVKRLGRLELTSRGEAVSRRVTAMLANLPRHIADREVRVALDRLNWNRECGSVNVATGVSGPGNLVLIELESEHVTEIATGFGEVGVAAEAVAGQAVKEMRRYLAAGVPVGIHLADQLLTMLALSEGGVFKTLSLSRHTLTNIEVIRHFMDVRIAVVEEGHDVVRVEVSS
jgi:RNA 3'-terminal phosphate cyclase (ATP)